MNYGDKYKKGVSQRGYLFYCVYNIPSSQPTKTQKAVITKAKMNCSR